MQINSDDLNGGLARPRVLLHCPGCRESEARSPRWLCGLSPRGPAKVAGTVGPEARPPPRAEERGLRPQAGGAATCPAAGARRQNGSCKPAGSWVTPSTFRAGPRMPRTPLNYSLNEALFSAINGFNYRPLRWGVPQRCQPMPRRLPSGGSSSKFPVFREERFSGPDVFLVAKL